ncbi:hypothetical protein QUF70_18915, partial [Desulfobacterales bacterium HSG17]|nr:hypothetical protein [Desulfobacterales bacterium HSG17]
MLAIVYSNRNRQNNVPESDKSTIDNNQMVTNKNLGLKENGIIQKEIVVTPTIDYKNLKKDNELKELMGSRKKDLGIQDSLDMIIKSNESFKIGGTRISMRDILEKAFIKEGTVFEEKIDASGAVLPQKIKEYGIYVV